MIKSINDYAILSNGVHMPWLGLGVLNTKDGDEVENAVIAALRAGYRAIDNASIYKNETGVGKALRESGIPRSEIFITTKVWNNSQREGTVLAAFEESRKRLGLEYVDLYLIHWPVPIKGIAGRTWKDLIKLYQDGRVRAIGVSNFMIHHLEELLSETDIVPMVNQVELHPFFTHKPLRQFCRDHNIQLEAYTPLMKGQLDLPVLNDLANKYGKTPAQIVLRWDLQNEVIVIPKSSNENRIRENTGIFDFELSADDMAKIDGLNCNKRFEGDPDNVTW